MSSMNRRTVLGTSAIALMGWSAAKAQTPAAAGDTEWLHYAKDLAATRYAPLDQINASNFNRLEVAWKFSTDALGPTMDAYYNATPLVAKGRLYTTAGNARYAVCLDGATGQLLWLYRHDEKGRLGTRGGAGFGLSYWTDGAVERIIYVTRSYQMVSLDAKTGLPDPTFGVGGEVDLRRDWDQEVDPTRAVVGLHSPPLIMGTTAVVGTAPSANVKAYVRGFDVRTGKRKWIFHTIPMKGEFGYETWRAGQAEAAGNTGVWAPMSADPELGLVYLPVEQPPTDILGQTRLGDTLYSQTLVAVDVETGERRWHYQTQHHGLWDHDIPSAGVLCDLPIGKTVIKALALPTKQGHLFVLDRTNGKPVWPIKEVKVPKGDVPGEEYSPTQPVPTKPPPFVRQGVTADDLIDYTPELKARALEIVSHYYMGPLFTPPMLSRQPNGPWGTLNLPGSQGGANWPGGSFDPESHMFFIYGKNAIEAQNVTQGPDGRLTGQNGRPPPNINDNNGGAFGGTASLKGGAVGLGGAPLPSWADKFTDPIRPGVLSIEGIPLSKPPYGVITAYDLTKGTIAWQATHGETPDALRNHPLLKGLNLPRTGQAGILGVLVTKSLVICGDAGLFTDEQGRKAARLRAYDKLTGKEVGAVFMERSQTGVAMTYMRGGKQYIVTAIGGMQGAELVAYRLADS
jgi:quinoprotein glucose dehydrogenase